MNRILVINPGATSTKIGVFDNTDVIFTKTIEHQGSDLKKFTHVFDQFQYRLNLITDLLVEQNISLDTLNAIVGRGGLLKPISSGTYSVNEAMLDDLRKAERGEHASNLGGVISHALAKQLDIPAFIVDPVSVDELEPVARISGLPELPRISLSHALNSKAVARKVAKELGKIYNEINLIVAHMGSGITVHAIKNGRTIDVTTNQDEGAFAPDRCGSLPAWSLIKLCYSGKYSEDELIKKTLGSGGMYAYLGTKDIREAAERGENGDELASLVLDAMIYQIAKEIGSMSTVFYGNVDRIILTGGIAYSERITKDLTERLKFIAPVILMPGEEELEALAEGVMRVLDGEEEPKVY